MRDGYCIVSLERFKQYGGSWEILGVEENLPGNALKVNKYYHSLIHLYF